MTFERANLNSTHPRNIATTLDISISKSRMRKADKDLRIAAMWKRRELGGVSVFLHG